MGKFAKASASILRLNNTDQKLFVEVEIFQITVELVELVLFKREG